MKQSISSEQAQLHAYVDGQLDHDALTRVEAQLSTSDRLRETVQDYRQLNDLLQQYYQPILEEKVPARLLQPRPVKRDRQGWFQRAAAAMILVTLGVVAGYQFGLYRSSSDSLAHEDADHVVAEAVMAYSIYTPEVRHPVEVSGSQRDHLVGWLSKRMGRRLVAPQLERFELTLLGGRLIASDDGPGALLMYEDPHGQRIVVYACLSDEKASSFRYAEQQGVSVYHWNDNALTYAIAGEIDRDRLLPVAESVYDQMSF